MQVGDLVKHWNKGVGIVISLTEPTLANPYQLATIYFSTGETDQFVTTSLYLYTLENISLDK